MPKIKKNLKPKKEIRLKKSTGTASNDLPKSKITKTKNKAIWTESYISLLLGVVFVIVGIIALASFLKTSNRKQITAISTVATQVPTIKKIAKKNNKKNVINPKEEYYIVKNNDDLWHIAKKIYGTGYNWTIIAKANHLENPGLIFTNQKLLIPKNKIISSIILNNHLGANEEAIDSNSYTIQKNDTLWEIAVRAYADGYKWTIIAEANHLENPNLIFSGNTIIIPR